MTRAVRVLVVVLGTLALSLGVKFGVDAALKPSEIEIEEFGTDINLPVCGQPGPSGDVGEQVPTDSLGDVEPQCRDDYSHVTIVACDKAPGALLGAPPCPGGGPD